MARGTPSSTAFLCLLLFFSVSSARIPLDVVGVDETNHISDSKSDTAANTILLPTDKPESESESATVIQWEPQTDTSDSKISEPNSETLHPMEVSSRSSLESDSDHVPLTLVRFHPINRHDIMRRPMPFSFRLGGHRCRHGHNFKPWDPRLPHREISYGNDMILSKFEDGGVVRQIPPRWTRFHHVAPRFSQEREMERSEQMERPHPHHHHHHHHEYHEDHEGGAFHEHHEDHEAGAFMKGIRKFLNHF